MATFSVSMTGSAAVMRYLNDVKKRASREAVMETAKAVQQRLILSVNGQILKTRSGRLKGGWSRPARATGTDDNPSAVISSDVAYAAIHEYGGTVRPKRTKWLTIPVGRALTPTGQAKVTARMFIADPGSLGYDASFFRKTTSGAVILGVRGKKRQIIEPVFVLRSEVRIPGRRYMTHSVNQALPRVPQIVEAAVNRAKQTLG